MAEPLALDVSPSVSNHFAWLRTQMALQRTLMAAVRTAVSLIGFGFTVAKFFQQLTEGATRHFAEEMPRNLGLVLIGAGVLSLVTFTWQYHQSSNYLRSEPFQPIMSGREHSMHTSSYLIAIVVMLIGVAAFASVFLRF